MSTISVPNLPESAPFTPRQRAWLNGFFAGLVSTSRVPVAALPSEQDSTSSSLAMHNVGTNSAATPTASAVIQTANSLTATEQFVASWRDVESDDVTQYAWHNPEISLDERMKLAEGKPLDLRLMAAMAQLNCGQCGYLCRTYAKAIETGEESDLKKCAPGGKKTSRLLARLGAELPSRAMQPAGITAAKLASAYASPAPFPTTAENTSATTSTSRLAYSRQNPFSAPATHVQNLSGKASSKDVRLISLSLAGSELQYKVGDALGVFPKNSKEQVESILRFIGADGSQAVRTPDGFSTTLRGALAENCDIKTASDELWQCLLNKADDRQDRKLLQQCMEDQPVEGLVKEPRVIDVIARFRSIPITGEELVRTLDTLKPRLYSIASSPLVDPNRVDLIVGVVRYVLDGQQRNGIASTFLANRMLGYEPVPVFVQPCHHFGLPADPDTPIIMIGPGTGIAPFRAFLHERRQTQATGDNWLFFGDQHQATDFLLHDELQEMQQSGVLTRLSTAFSRDQDERIYVQHRLLQDSEAVWQWLERGAHFYVCGDATKMAGDIDRALHEVIHCASGLSHEAAAQYVRDMSKSGRYQRDVY
ncbi:MAG: sulfite reductase subunit alpha [Pirellulaceae bacterium]